MRRTRLRPCAGCGRLLTGSQSASCVFGCGAYYCRRGRQQCADQHAKTCPALQDLRTPHQRAGEQPVTATIDTTNHLIRRDSAVRQIAERIAAGDDWTITVPPGALSSVTEALDPVAPWLAYVDNGTGLVLRTGLRGAILLADQLTSTAAVISVPKTVDASTLGAALSHPMPADGDQDIVILRTDGGPIFWPLLFVDALDLIDPRCAAELRANHLPNLN